MLVVRTDVPGTASPMKPQAPAIDVQSLLHSIQELTTLADQYDPDRDAIARVHGEILDALKAAETQVHRAAEAVFLRPQGSSRCNGVPLEPILRQPRVSEGPKDIPALKAILDIFPGTAFRLQFGQYTLGRLWTIAQEKNIVHRSDFAVLGTILENAGNGVSLETLESRTGYPLEDVRASLRRLCEKGVIHEHVSTVYAIAK